MPNLERRPKVLKQEDGSLRISNIRSDTDPSSSLSIVITNGGDVGISIVDPERGIVGVELAPFQGGGANPDVTAKFRNFATELADLIESQGE